MRKLPEYLATAPLRSIFVTYSLIISISIWLASLLWASPASDALTPPMLVGAIVGGFPGGLMVSLVFGQARRREREAAGISRVSDWLLIVRMLQAGRLSPDPSLDRPTLLLIEYRRERLRRDARSWPWICAISMAAALFFIVHGSVDHALPEVGLGLFGLPSMVWTFIAVQKSRERGRSRLDQMESEVRQRASA